MSKTDSLSSRKPSLIRSSMIYSSFTLISRIFGFFRDLAVTYTMGASAGIAADAFNTAFAFPNLFRRIFAEGAFAAAFVPAYSKSLEQDGEEIADVLAADAMAVLAAATLAITVIAELTMPWLMLIMRPGFGAIPGKLNLAVMLTQITMPYLPCMAIYAHLSGVLNARNRFILSGAAPILLNLWTLAVVLPAHTPRDAAIYASWGIVAAGISQAALLWWGVNKSGAKVTWRWPRMTPQIKTLIMLAIPGALAASATQINIFVSQFLASGINGAASWLAVADRLYQLPLGLVGVAVGVALLPQLSRAVHAKNKQVAQEAMDEAMVFSMALTLPAAAAMVAIPGFLIDALYTRGEFVAYDAQNTAAALMQYGWGVPAFVLQQLMARAFFARQDTRTPMIYSMISVAANIGFGLVLFRLVGIAGIAAATSIASWLNVVMMMITLGRRDHYLPSVKAASKMGRGLTASLILAGLLVLTVHFRTPLEGLLGWAHLGKIGPKEVLVGIVFVLAAGIYPFLLFATGGVSPADVRAALRRKPADGPSEGPADLP